jgi:hypothetical protein
MKKKRSSKSKPAERGVTLKEWKQSFGKMSPDEHIAMLEKRGLAADLCEFLAHELRVFVNAQN